MRASGPARRIGVAGALAAILVVAGCSSGGSKSSDSTAGASSTTAAAATSQAFADWEPPACDRDVTSPPKVVPVEGSSSDHDLTSFDGTTIRIHWFPRVDADGSGSPTVLLGPGWSLPGDTDTDPSAAPGPQTVVTIGSLHAAGYNVATWDPRGFGKSSGTVTIDSADHEAADVSALIDWVSAQDGVALDGPGNPRLGMVGMSYGGGIQLVTAATDCRVDVITPTIAWNSLGTSLFPADTYKAGWGEMLVSISSKADLDPHIASANAAALATGSLSQEDREWFVARGPDHLLGDIGIPTLIVQGTVDNLFPLSEGVQTYRALSANGIPLAMTWFCGGHGVCNNPADPDGYVRDAVMNWLARYLGDDAGAPEVPTFSTTDQNGAVHAFAGFPPAPAGTSVYAFAASGTLELQPDGGSGPLATAPDGDAIGALAKAITPDKADRALNVPVPVTGASRLVLGAPQLDLGYTCTLDAPATKPTRIFAQIVDDETGRVLGNQITPIATVCDGLLHHQRVELEPVVFASKGSSKLTLQLVATTVAYAVPQMGGTVDIARIGLTLPTVAG